MTSMRTLWVGVRYFAGSGSRDCGSKGLREQWIVGLREQWIVGLREQGFVGLWVEGSEGVGSKRVRARGALTGAVAALLIDIAMGSMLV